MEPVVREELDALHERLDVMEKQLADLVRMFAATQPAVVGHKKLKGAVEEDEIIPASDKRVAKG